MHPDFQLKTARLRLRPMRDADVPALSLVLSDPDQMAHYPAPFDRAGVEAWVRRTHERYARDGFALWTVELLDTGTVIGDCGPTMQTLGGAPVIEIGWHIVPAHQGRGYATEAAAASLAWVFANTDAERVVSFMTATNLASRRVAEKLHARFLGPMEDRAGLPHVAFETRRDEAWPSA
jgi:RimJ/RimL family protein N-acetyltransferase